MNSALGDALDRGATGISDSAYAARDSLADTVSKLRTDVARIQETVSKFISEAGGDAARTARNVSQAVASQVGSAASGLVNAGADMASSAAEQTKTFASEFESMARRNPLRTLAGALLAGIVIGMMTRRRGRS